MTKAVVKGKDNKVLTFEDFCKNTKESVKELEGFDASSIIASIQPYYESAAFNTAARLVRFFAKKHAAMNKILLKHTSRPFITYKYKKLDMDTGHLAYPFVVDVNGKKEVKVRVFKNLTLNYHHAEDTGEGIHDKETVQDLHETHWDYPFALVKFFNDMGADLADTNKAKKWTPSSRAIKAVKAYTDMTMAKYLTNYTAMKSKMQMTDSKIRDIAAAVTDEYMPVEIKIATSIKELVDAYESGPSSCMKASSSSSEGWRESFKSTRHLLSTEPEKVVHPVAFYHNCPSTGFAYVMRGKNCIARCVLYTHEGVKYYTKIYTSDGSIHTKMQNTLIDMGYEKAGDKSTGNYHTLSEEFEVPSIKLGSHDIVCTPYADMFTNGWKPVFDKSSNMFVFAAAPKNKGDGKLIRSTRGYYRACDLVTRTCAYCSMSIKAGGKGISSEDGVDFCSTSHAKAAGYTKALDSEHHYRWVLSGTAYPDALLPSAYYTNHSSALSNGAVPVLSALGLPEDDSSVSMYGMVIKYKDNTYRISEDYFYSLEGRGLISGGGGHNTIKKLPTEITSSINIKVKKGEFRIAV